MSSKEPHRKGSLKSEIIDTVEFKKKRGPHEAAFSIYKIFYSIRL